MKSAAPTLALLVERRPRVVWIADGSGSLYAVPTPEQQGDILERVFIAGDACADCYWCERNGDGWNEPRTRDCGLRRDAAQECPGYADELEAWEHEQSEALSDDDLKEIERLLKELRQ